MKINDEESRIKANFRRAKVLIVEDSDDHWVLIKRALQHCLSEVVAERVSSPEQALALLNTWRYEEWEIPKLILQDLYLPDSKDGWGLLQQIKKMPVPFCQIPIVILSSSAVRSDVMEAYSLGASSYMIKPITFDEWITYFRELRTYWWETVSLPPLNYTLS
ncbi:response regulator [Spirosoma aerophilum]